MILRKPDFYDCFKCTASKCSDTCCVGWEIDIDKASQETYRKVPGTFGDKLRANIESTLGIAAQIKLMPPHSLPRVEGKAKRVEDRRQLH